MRFNATDVDGAGDQFGEGSQPFRVAVVRGGISASD